MLGLFSLQAHEILGLEVLTLLLEEPTDDSVEVAIGFLKEIGAKLTEVSPKGIIAIFERLRNILHEATIDKRVQYMIEVMFATRKDGFKVKIRREQRNYAFINKELFSNNRKKLIMYFILISGPSLHS